MGVFSSKKQEQPKVRRDKVMKILQAKMAEEDTGHRGLDTPEWKRAKKRLDDSMDDATQAEIRAAHEAAKRNGYYF